MLSDSDLFCRVCGYQSDEPPWGVDGVTPTFEICPCCGVEHGYEDATLQGVLKYRARWFESGCKWSISRLKPEIWDQHKQMANVPSGFDGEDASDKSAK